MRSPRDTDEGARADAAETPVRRRLRVGRLLATSTTTCVLAAAFLAAPVAGLPWNPVAAEQDAPSADAAGEGVSVGVVGASSTEGPATVEEVLGVLERAELASKDAGRGVSPEVQQAAAELGMLLSTYLAQQPDAAPAATPFASPDAETPVPVVSALPGNLPASVPDPADTVTVANQVSGGPAREKADGGGATDPEPAAGSGPVKAGVMPGPRTPVQGTAPDESVAATGPADGTADDTPQGSTGDLPGGEAPAGATDPADGTDLGGVAPEGTAPQDGTTPEGGTTPPGGTAPADGAQDAPSTEPQHEADAVTFDDVVVAATRLATLLDPSLTTLAGGILPAGADGAAGTDAARATLTAGLREIVDRYGKSTAGYANGRIPASALCPLDFAPGHMLRCDAAEQLTALSAEYEKEFGVPIPMTDSYRSYDSQVRLKATKGYLAATPGWSNHGWGLAVDLSTPISSGTTAQYVWMRVHGPDYGWDNPSWARLDGSKPEPWHFEFFAAGPIPNRAWKADDVGATGAAQDKAAQHGPDSTSGKDDARGTTSKGGTSDGKKSDGKKSDGSKTGDSSKPGSKPGSKPTDSTGAPIEKPGGSTPDKGDGTPAPAKVTVPDVTGMDAGAAKAKLQALGLKVTTTTKASDAPAGQVVTTTGAGTKVTKGSTVALVVSSGPAKVAVPDVTGKTIADATAELEALGFTVTSTTQADPEAPEGQVLSTEGAGTKVAKGSTVALVVSSGPEKAPECSADQIAAGEAAVATETTDDDAALQDLLGCQLPEDQQDGALAQALAAIRDEE